MTGRNTLYTCSRQLINANRSKSRYEASYRPIIPISCITNR